METQAFPLRSPLCDAKSNMALSAEYVSVLMGKHMKRDIANKECVLYVLKSFPLHQKDFKSKS